MKLFRYPLLARIVAPGLSERMRALKFYAGYFRWPVLFVVGAVLADKLIYYGVLPLAGYLTEKFEAASARIELARGEDKAALLSIRAALLHTRDDAALWKLAARITEKLESPDAIYCWQQANRLQPGSFETQILLANAALRHGQVEIADAALREIAPAEQEDPSFQFAAGQLADLTGQKQRARDLFSRLEAAHPRDAATLRVLARWHMESREFPQARRQLLVLLSRRESRTEALRLLVQLALLSKDFPQALTWSDELLHASDASLADRIQRLDLLPSSSAAFESTLAGLMATMRRDEIVPVVTWMIAHQRAEQALIWIRMLPENMQNDPVMGIARAHCLVALGLWEHLRDIQATDFWPGHEAERLMFLTRACFQLGAEADGRAAWSQAVLACRDYSDYLTLIDYAAADGPSDPAAAWWEDELAQAESQMALQYPGQAWLLHALLRYEIARRDSLQVEHLEGRLAALDPGDADAAARYALSRLLRGVQVEKASASLEHLLPENPGDPVVATAAAYSLYRQGRFGEALATVGGLTPQELDAPERAAIIGALLAAGGPIDQARAHLQDALAQPQLSDEERVLANRSLDLLAYRRAMAALLHGGDLEARNPTPGGFVLQGRGNQTPAIFLIAQSVSLARAGSAEDSVRLLAGIDVSSLDAVGLTLYVGGVLQLAGQPAAAAPYLELSPDLPTAGAAEKTHRALEAWWSRQTRSPFTPALMAGLFAAYRGLDSCDADPAFWRRDEGREVQLVRSALLHGVEIESAEDRLHRLLGHVPLTPEIQAQFAYALLLQGQARAAQERMDLLTSADLVQPEPSLYYGVILAACGEKKAALPYLQRATDADLMPEQRALVLRAERMP